MTSSPDVTEGGLDPATAHAFRSTWPAAETLHLHGFDVPRSPKSGGGRVTAARSNGPWTVGDIEAAAAQQTRLGQDQLFSVWDADTQLSDALTLAGFQATNPTCVMATAVAGLADAPLPRMKAFACWPPLAMQVELWADTGIDATRQAVMDRVALPKAALLGRARDRAAGIGFVAVDGPVAMVHALAVLPDFRRQGVAKWMLQLAARFARDNGADSIALAVARQNTGAVALYEKLGFREVAGYWYFQRD